MDPNETFRMIVKGLLDLSAVGGDNEACREELCMHLDAMSQWIDKGGFIPAVDSLESTLIERLDNYYYVEKRVL